MKPLLRKKLSGIQNRTVIMLFLNMVPKWKSGGQQEGLDVIIVNPGIIMVPDSKKAVAFLRVANGLRYYTLGKGAFVAG
jgi:hypothetical protein